MDIFVPIVICLIVFILFSLCGYCCKRNRNQGTVLSTPVLITTTTTHVPQQLHNANASHPTSWQPPVGQYPSHTPYPGTQPPYQGAQPPYPGAQPPYPGAQPPYPGAQSLYPSYPANPPYPTGNVSAMPQPGAPVPSQLGFQHGGQGHGAPYPPAQGYQPPHAGPQAQVQPPSYSEAVTHEVYSKQAPYNPNY